MLMSEMAAETPERLTWQEVQALRSKYERILAYAENDPTGSIKKFWTDLRKFIRDQSNGDPKAITTWVSTNIRGVEAFQDMNFAQLDNLVEDIQPDKTADVEREYEKVRLDVTDIAERIGAPLSQERLAEVVDQARRNLWDAQDIENALRGDLSRALESGENLMGDAGTYQTTLMQWANLNGIGIDASTAAKYVANMTLGVQSLDDVKQDLRETYLIGAYPAWSEKIRQGFDPWQISSPYRTSVAKLLELDPDQVGLDDPLVKMGLQSTGNDGQPRVVPLYEFEQQVRNDPRWQKTDNAYQTYTRVGSDLLRMFGFR